MNPRRATEAMFLTHKFALLFDNNCFSLPSTSIHSIHPFDARISTMPRHFPSRMPVLAIVRNRLNYSSIQDVLDASDQGANSTGVIVYGHHNNININSRPVCAEDGESEFDSDASSSSSDGDTVLGRPRAAFHGGFGGGGGHGRGRRPSRRLGRRHEPLRILPDHGAAGGRGRRSNARRGRNVVKLTSDMVLRTAIATPDVGEVRLPRGGFSVETTHLERNGLLRCHEITFADGKIRLMATPGVAGKNFAAKLLGLFHRMLSNEDQGLYHHRLMMLDDARFAPFAGALTNRLKKELVMCAAYIAFVFGRGPYAFTGIGCFPTNEKPSCADFATYRYKAEEQYARALSMAATIATYFNVEEPMHQYTVEDIMSYNIYRGIKEELNSRLKPQGIFSRFHESAGSIRDVGTTILPLFLFMDSLLPDELWRGQCATDQVRVRPGEMDLIRSNPYIDLLDPSGWR